MTPVLVLAIFCGWLDELPKADDVEVRVAGSRDGIRTIDVEIEFNVAHPDPKIKAPPRQRVNYRIWDDGIHYRADRETDRTDGMAYQVMCDECVRPGHAVFVQSRDLTFAVELFRKTQKKGSSAWRLYGFDPRGLGHFSTTHMNMTGGDGRPVPPLQDVSRGQSPRRVAAGRWRDQDCLFLDSEFVTTGSPQRIVVVPAMNYAITEISAEFKQPDGSVYRHRRVSELTQVPGVNVWYPTETDYRIEVDGRLHTSEKATVKRVTVNQPISPSVFTLAGLGLEEGRPVTMPDKASPMMWSRGRLVPYVPADERLIEDEPPVPVNPPRTDWTAYLYGASAVLFAGLAVALLRRMAIRNRG